MGLEAEFTRQLKQAKSAGRPKEQTAGIKVRDN